METSTGRSPTEPKPTRLIVEQLTSLKADNQSSGQEFQVKDITLGRWRPEGSFSYYRLTDLSRTRKIEILMRDGLGMKKVDLPSAILGKIVAFMGEDNKRNGKFDCASFAHYVNDVPYEFSKFFPEKWDIIKFGEGKLKAGDTIMISEDPEYRQVTHFAIYLGKGVYLSKFGNKGKLIAASLEEMEKGFGGKNVFQIKPKPKE